MGCGATAAPAAPAPPLAKPAPTPKLGVAATPADSVPPHGRWELEELAEMRWTVTQNTAKLITLAEGAKCDMVLSPYESSTWVSEGEDAEALWAGVQEVVLSYVPEDADFPSGGVSPGMPSVASTAAPAGDGLCGPPLNTVTAYGTLLGWLHQRGELTPARQCIFDPSRLLNIKDHALQIAELDALLSLPFDASMSAHRQLAFSVYAKFVRLGDVGSRPQSCPRCGPHWEAMGFQGEDFSTDLRGVGILGLLHLLSFFGSYPETARSFFASNAEREARFGRNGAVPVACASLNFSSLTILALREGRLSAICRRAKSVHGAVLKMHAALMASFVREFRSRPDATVLAFGEILEQLKRKAHACPSSLLQDLREHAPPAERASAESFAVVRPLLLGEAQPPVSSLSSGEVLEMVRKKSSERVGTALAAGVPPVPQAFHPSMLARACSQSPAEEVEAVFRMICREGHPHASAASLRATAEDLRFFLCDALGCESAEVDRFVQRVDGNADGQVDLDEFQRGFSLLNSHRVSKRERESFLRRPGSIQGEQFTLEDLRGCEVHVLDHVACCTVDGCNSCEILMGPSAASIFVRDCEDCTFYFATQQLRTRRCTRCTFFLFSATEPIIESSFSLRFAPLALAYPGLADQLRCAGLDTRRNLWNAIFDFSSPDDCRRHWTPAALGECGQYRLLLDGSSGADAAAAQLSAADAAVFPAVTEEVLHAAPLQSGLDAGRRVDQGP